MWSRGDFIAFAGIALGLLGTVATIISLGERRARRALLAVLCLVLIGSAVVFRRVEQVLAEATRRQQALLTAQAAQIQIEKENARKELIREARERVRQEDARRESLERLAKELSRTQQVSTEAERRIAYEDAVVEAMSRIQKARTERTAAELRAKEARDLQQSRAAIVGHWKSPWYAENLIFTHDGKLTSSTNLDATYEFVDATHIVVQPTVFGIMKGLSGTWEVQVGPDKLIIKGAFARNGVYMRRASG